MTKKAKAAIALIVLGVWILIADSHWKNREREIALCIHSMTTYNYISNILVLEIDIESSYQFRRIARVICLENIGGGEKWGTPPGMSYFEMILLLPVIHRWSWHF